MAKPKLLRSIANRFIIFQEFVSVYLLGIPHLVFRHKRKKVAYHKVYINEKFSGREKVSKKSASTKRDKHL